MTSSPVPALERGSSTALRPGPVGSSIALVAFLERRLPARGWSPRIISENGQSESNGWAPAHSPRGDR
jgi:hypothetical protein